MFKVSTFPPIFASRRHPAWLLLREERKSECIIFQPAVWEMGVNDSSKVGGWILFSVFIAVMFWSDCHSLVVMWAHVSGLRSHWCNRMSTPSPHTSQLASSANKGENSLSRCWLFILGKKLGMTWVIGMDSGGRDRDDIWDVTLMPRWCQAAKHILQSSNDTRENSKRSQNVNKAVTAP